MICDLVDWKFTLQSKQEKSKASTHRHGRLLRIHRIAKRTENRSSFRSKSCRTSNRIACRRVKCDTFGIRSTLHASACLCSSSPLEWIDSKISKLFAHFHSAATHLGINSNDCIALLASVGEDALVALDAVRMFVSQHVALSSEALVAVPAAEVARMPVLRHGLCVLAAKN